MPSIVFSDVGLRAIEPPASGTADYWDTKFKGFGVRVSQGGTKTFVLNIHKARRSLGRYGIVSLAEARAEAKRILAQKTLGQTRPQSITFTLAFDAFLAEKEKSRRARTIKDYKRLINLHFPFKGQLADVKHPDIERRLVRIKSRSEHNHALQNAKTFFTWAQRRRYITDNPTIGFSKHKLPNRARVMTDAELKSIWEVTAEPTTHNTIVRLLVLLGARKTEVANLRWSWISEKCITWPPEIMKNHREQTLPMFPLLRITLDKIAKDGDLLFPARGYSDRPFSGWSKAKVALDNAANIDGLTLHDIRRSWASRNAAWAAPHIVERALSHSSGTISGVAAVYNRFKYEDEVRDCYSRWEAHLLQLFAAQ